MGSHVMLCVCTFNHLTNIALDLKTSDEQSMYAIQIEGSIDFGQV